MDSSVTAWLLKQQGHEVLGLSLVLYEARMKSSFSGCCSLEAINDAARTAAAVGVKHARLDLRDEFMEHVIEPFIEAYGSGVTPNPCILCNKYIKFPYLLKYADEVGASLISTGHYARTTVGNRMEGPTLLQKGVDPKKDQSYVLYVLTREALDRLSLPLGGMKKDDVRETALRLGLPAASRPESQEICFIEDNRYCNFLKDIAADTSGPLIHAVTGKVLAMHKGVHLYTMGQRKRLGIATGTPLFVVRIDPAERAVYVGPREMAMYREFRVDDVSWLVPQATSKGTFSATVKVRSTMRDEPAALELQGDTCVRVIFDEPQWAPAPGQSAVFYDNETVLGGGVITV